jgi:hypothetical protein
LEEAYKGNKYVFKKRKQVRNEQGDIDITDIRRR